MQRRVESALVAKVGAFVFAGVLGLPVTLPASGGQVNVVVASATMSRDEGVAALIDPWTAVAELRAAVRSSTVARSELPTASASAASVEEAPAPEPAAAPVVAAPPPPAPVVVAPPPVPVAPPVAAGGGTVLASWYGPGFYGNRTACGLTFTPELLGVAHLTLPCGTRLTLTSPSGRTVTVPVIDRGPYVAGRTLDLSNATKNALACSDLCWVRMVVGP